MEPQTTLQDDFLERLCRTNKAELETYLTQMVGSADIARALVKDSFARVRMSRPEQAAFPRAMLFAVATNVAITHLRKWRAERIGQAAALDSEEAQAPSSDRVQDRQVSPGEYAASLASAIRALRLSHRKVFVMATVQGKPRQEIAVTLGISETRVDKRMTRALKSLSDHLSARGISLTGSGPSFH